MPRGEKLLLLGSQRTLGYIYLFQKVCFSCARGLLLPQVLGLSEGDFLPWRGQWLCWSWSRRTLVGSKPQNVSLPKLWEHTERAQRGILSVFYYQ